MSSFGRKPTVEASIERATSRKTYVAIAFGKKPKVDTSKIDVTGQFLGSSIIAYDRRTDTSLIIKSPTRNAWTIDQAVTDAVALSREIRSGK